MSMFSRKPEAFAFIFLYIFCNAREEMFTNCLLFAAWGVFWSDFMNKHFPSSVTMPDKTLSRLD